MALGDLLSGENPDCVVVICRDAEGRPIAFQRYVPCRRGRALSLDVMRRDPNSPNGVNERMIVDVVDWCRTSGTSEVSLNFVAFRSLLDEDADLESLKSVTAWFLRRFEGTWGIQLDSLRLFNLKFRPRWAPRFGIYRSPGDVPAIAFAILDAEGFLPFDAGRAEPEEMQDDVSADLLRLPA
jgi:lysyl-tRNA synthetase class 2